MFYVMSDIHGRDDMLSEMLDLIQFDENKDYLFILGDIVDRGGDLSALFHVRDMVNKSCCELILGNHEGQLVNTLTGFSSANEVSDAIDKMNELQTKKERWKYANSLTKSVISISLLHAIIEVQNSLLNNIKSVNRAHSLEQVRSLHHLNQMTKEERNSLFAFLTSRPTYKALELNGKKIILVHGGYKPAKTDDLLFTLYARDDFYLKPVEEDDTVVIFGHTPTNTIKVTKYGKMEIPYTIWHDESGDKIGIDCGAAYPNGQLACLRLDDMEEFYIPNKRNMIVPLEYRNQQVEILKDYERAIRKICSGKNGGGASIFNLDE